MSWFALVKTQYILLAFSNFDAQTPHHMKVTNAGLHALRGAWEKQTGR
jgi:hypothetical protein